MELKVTFFCLVLSCSLSLANVFPPPTLYDEWGYPYFFYPYSDYQDLVGRNIYTDASLSHLGLYPEQGQRLYPGQEQGLYPGQGQGLYPRQGQGLHQRQDHGLYSRQGLYPGQVLYQGQGLYPGQGQGLYPGLGLYPRQLQGLYPGQGQGLYPGLGLYPRQLQGLYPGQGHDFYHPLVQSHFSANNPIDRLYTILDHDETRGRSDYRRTVECEYNEGGYIRSGDKCLRLIREEANFEDATEQCYHDGGELWVPEMDNPDLERQLLHEFQDIYSISDKDLWVGINLEDGHLLTTHGDDVTDTYFGFLAKVSEDQTSSCVILDFSDGYPRFKGRDCDLANDFICMYDFHAQDSGLKEELLLLR